MLVASKFEVHRDVVIDRVKEMTGVDMRSIARDADVAIVIEALEVLRHRGLSDSELL